MNKRLRTLLAMALLVTMLLTITGGAAASEIQTTPNAGDLPIVTEPYTLKIGLQKYGQVEDYINNSFTKHLQESTGITLDIEIYPIDEGNQKMEVLIASGAKLPDMFLGDNLFGTVNRQNTVFRHAQNGIFLPLDELIEEYGVNMMSMVDKVKNKNFMNLLRYPDGKIYALPSYHEQTSNEYSLRAMINKTWLDKLGLEVPKTTEELVTVLREFKTKDPNGNGLPDEIGVMGGGSWHQFAAEFLMNSFIYTDGETRWNISDGKLDIPYNKEEWREGLRYINGLIEEGLFDPLSFTQDGAAFKAIATAGDSNSIGVVVTAGMGQLFAASMSDRKGEYAPLDPLVGPKGVNFAARYPINPAPGAVITKDCERPDIAMRFLDFMMSDENSVFSRFGEPGVDWILPEEGQVALGEKWGATPEIFTILIWGGTSHSSHWNDMGPHILLEKYSDGQAWNGDPTDAEYMIATTVPGLLGKGPEEVCTLILYDEDQTAEIADIQITLTTYVKESIARFATGDLDLDKDWDSYLQELENIGLSKYIEISQAAYDRMLGK